MFSYTDSITEVTSSHKQNNTNGYNNGNSSNTIHLPYRNLEAEAV